MSIGAVVRRVRAYGGQFLLLAALAAVTLALIAGVPRLVNGRTEAGLQSFLRSQPATVRDVTYATDTIFNAGNGTSLMEAFAADLPRLQDEMPPPVRALVDRRWFTAETDPGRLTGPDLAARNLLVDLGLRSMPGVAEAGRLTGGRWPDPAATAEDPVEVALAAEVAGKLNLRVGSKLTLAGPQSATPEGAPDPVRALVVGVFEPRDRAEGFWDGLPQALRVIEPTGDAEPFVALGVVDPATLDRLSADGWGLRFAWRYRMGASGIHAVDADRLIGDVDRMGRQAQGRAFTQGLDIPLRQFQDQVASVRTVLAVSATGALGALGGLVILAAGLTVRRRRTEFTLLRARGGTALVGARRSLSESLLVLLPAAGAGFALGNLAPGPAAESAPAAAVAATLLIVLALPLATLALPTGVAQRRDLVTMRPSARRITMEAGLVLLAVIGVLLLRRRGLVPGVVDPLLVSVPVLLAVAAAVLTIRLYPWPLRLLGRLAARTRGSVAFLGSARGARAVVTTPLVVVVLAVASAAFCGVVAAGVEASRDRVAARQVPADGLIRGERLAPDTAAELARLPGVRRASPILQEAGQRLATDEDGTDLRVGEVSVLLVNGPELEALVRDSDVPVGVPDALLGSGDAGPLPAVVSPAVAADLAAAGRDGSAFVGVQGQRYEFRVAARADSFPLLRGETTRFVVLPWQQLPRRTTDVTPTGFLVAGDRLDVSELRRVGNEGQRRFARGGTIVGREQPLDVEVTTWTQARRQVGEGGVNAVLGFGFTAGAVVGTALGLLAVAFVVLAGARARGQALSQLRTLGLSRGQSRGLLLVELGPLVGVAVVTGAVVGALLPLLLNPVLGLSAFTGGAPVEVAFEPRLVVGVVVLGAVALGFAIVVEALNNRRTRLGEALRLGEES
ncbi:FtsX-like permease family protein [Micromonospora sediminicola]|uniref:FtsX-like permease family protein n=1 Tax=Micromonospora sediminicola TaxID=946078 RepID=UPI0033DEE7F5